MKESTKVLIAVGIIAVMWIGFVFALFEWNQHKINATRESVNYRRDSIHGNATGNPPPIDIGQYYPWHTLASLVGMGILVCLTWLLLTKTNTLDKIDHFLKSPTS